MNLLNFPILLFLPKKTVIGPLKKFKFLITAWLESLTESGMYVNQSLRYLKKDVQQVRKRLTRVSKKNLIDEIYTKNK